MSGLFLWKKLINLFSSSDNYYEIKRFKMIQINFLNIQFLQIIFRHRTRIIDSYHIVLSGVVLFTIAIVLIFGKSL